MATITIPSTPDFDSVKPIYRRSSKISVSPYTFTQQVYSWQGKLKVVEIILPPMTESDFNDWAEFFDDLNGYENTFNLDLSSYYPHETGITSVAMRMADPDFSWDISTALHYSTSFMAMEAL